MRPQQKNRQRGRGPGGGNNNNRGRNQNPLSRSYESTGPDLKVRGNAQQVADKYTQLARDATSAGDRVMAENYLQHAEHYNRIILTAQAEQAELQRRRDEQMQARGERGERDDRRRDRDDRRDDRGRDDRARDDRVRDERQDDVRADGQDGEGGRRRRRRDREDAPRETARENVREEARTEARVDPIEAPRPEAEGMPLSRSEGEPTGERKPRRGRRTKPAPVEMAVDGGPTTGDSDAAGEAPAGAEEGLARTVTRTRRRKAPIKPEPAASDAAE